MTKQDKINACTSILSTYTGADKYILMMQRDYNVGYSLSDFAVDYIIANYTKTPEVVNRIVKIQPWLGEEKAKIWKIDFVPEVLYVTTLYGETKTSYCCDVVYRKSNPVPTLTFLPKNGIIGPIRVDDFHSRIIDIEPYNEALRKINPSYSIMPHQVESIKFLLARKKCILALDQGLGKSLVSVVASMMVPNSKVLIICPASLKSNWRDEIVRFSPENSVSIISSTRDMNKSELLEFLGLPDNGKLKVNELREMAEAKGKWNPGSRFTILNYDIIDEFHKLPANRSKLAKEQALRDSKLLSARFDVVIIDEAHRLSNNSSNRSRVILDYLKNSKNEHTWLLTGTMVTNSPVELYSILRLIENDVTSNYRYYMEHYAGMSRIPKKGEWKRCWNEWSSKQLDLFGERMFTYYGSMTDDYKMKFDRYLEEHAKFINVTGEPKNLDELAERISHLYYRITKEDIAGMVNKEVITVAYSMTPEQMVRYHQLWDEFEEEKRLDGKDVSEYKSLMEGSVLRKYVSELMIDKTKDAIHRIISKGDKVFVVCAYDDEINSLKEHFGDISVVYNGKCNAKQKDAAVKAFNDDPNVMVFIGNINAAGVGINLNKSCHIALFQNPNYTYADFSQACDRIHRIGSKQDVKIYVQYFRNTIYEHMIDIIKGKQDVFDNVIKTEQNKAAL